MEPKFLDKVRFLSYTCEYKMSLVFPPPNEDDGREARIYRIGSARVFSAGKSRKLFHQNLNSFSPDAGSTGSKCISLKELSVAVINIYVGNLPFKINEDQLRELFETYGQVEAATIISDKFTGRPRGFGFVKMPDREEGLRAIQELDSQDYLGRSLKVNEAKPRNDRLERPGGDRPRF